MSMVTDQVRVYSSGALVSTGTAMSGTMLSSGINDSMSLASGGVVSDVHILAGGTMTAASGGTIGNIELTSGVYSGGGVCSGNSAWYGAGICNTMGSLVLTGGTFLQNLAVSLNGYAGQGGAVEGYGGDMRIEASLFASNSAAGGGGAVLALYCDSAVIERSLFHANSAMYAGAVQFNQTHGTITDCVFSGNSSPFGGAFECHNGASAVLVGNTFDGCIGSQGGAVFNDSFNGAVSELTISGGAFRTNSAFFGGAVLNSGGILSLQNVLFEGNCTLYDSDSYTGGYGGAVGNYANGVLAMSDCILSVNHAVYGGAIANTIQYGSDDHVSIQASGGQFHANTAQYGGAVYLQGAGEDEAVFLDGVFTSNSAGYAGGAVCNCYGLLTVSGGTFADNSTANDGGAIANWNSASITGVEFSRNSAGVCGGAISVCWGVSMAVSGSTFTANHAASGGAVFADEHAVSVQISDCVFEGNSDTGNGGAVCIKGGNASIQDCRFLTASDTISNSAALTLVGFNSFAGAFSTETTVNAAGASIDLNLSQRDRRDAGTAILENYSKFSIDAATSFSITISPDQAAGMYRLINDADSFDREVAVSNGILSGTLAPGESILLNGLNLSMSTESTGSICLTVSGMPEFMANPWRGTDSSAPNYLQVLSGTASLYGQGEGGLDSFSETGAMAFGGGSASTDGGGIFFAANGVSRDSLLIFGGNDNAALDGAVFCRVSGCTAARIMGGSRVASSLSQTANTNLVIDNGTIVDSVFGGSNISIRPEETVFTENGAAFTTISGATVRKYLAGGSILSTNAKEIRTGNITLNLTGGLFEATVCCGSFLSSATGSSSAQCGLNLFISGGTFERRIYGAHAAAKRDFSENMSVDGGAVIYIDASKDRIIFHDSIFCGGSGYSLIRGNTTLSLTGRGENLVFDEKSVISGDCQAARWNGTFANGYWHGGRYVSGERKLAFTDFTGNFDTSNFRFFDTIEFTNSHTVFTKYLSMGEIENWNFTAGDTDSAAFEWMNGENDFFNDSINITCSLNQWTLAKFGSREQCSALEDAKSVLLNGESAVWSEESGWVSASYRLARDEAGCSLQFSKLA